MEIKVVTGANLGDEGKGLVSYCLAKEAAEKNRPLQWRRPEGSYCWRQGVPLPWYWCSCR